MTLVLLLAPFEHFGPVLIVTVVLMVHAFRNRGSEDEEPNG
jgi:hypothetical protein